VPRAVPDFRNLDRQARAATDKLSFKNIMGSINAQSVGPDRSTYIDYTHLHVSGLTSANGDFNGLYTRGVNDYNIVYYAKTLIFNGINTTIFLADGDLIGTPTGTWAYMISNNDVGDDFLTNSTAASDAPLPAGNANWSNFSNYGVSGRINVAYDRTGF